MLGVQLSEVTAVPAVLLMYNIKERVLWFVFFFVLCGGLLLSNWENSKAKDMKA